MPYSPTSRNRSPRIPWLYVAGCLLILAGVATPLWRWSTPAKAEAAVAPINASPWRLQNIEAIRVGQRVVTDAANRTETLPTAVDPATWRRVTIVGTREMASGKEDRIVVQTIVPPTWLEFFDAHVGAVVPYPLDLVQMGIPEELDGEITDIAPCPEILEGPGRVVLSTVHHLSHDVWQLNLAAEDGASESLKSTGFHPFYSVDRDDYVQVHELRAGERLQGSQGLVTLTAKKPVAGYHEVYNLTVEDEHVYRVGKHCVLVHNMQCRPSFLTSKEFAELPETGSINPWRLRNSQDTAGWTFKPPYHNSNIGEAAYGLREGKISPQQFGEVLIVERNGMIFSVDNRRILTFRSAGVDIPYRKTTWDKLTKGQRRHFTTVDNGESITILFDVLKQKRGVRMHVDGPNDEIYEMNSRSDLANFVYALCDELERDPDAWENKDLHTFLLAFARFLNDADGYYRNMNEDFDAKAPSWRLIADSLLAATCYD